MKVILALGSVIIIALVLLHFLNLNEGDVSWFTAMIADEDSERVILVTAQIGNGLTSGSEINYHFADRTRFALISVEQGEIGRFGNKLDIYIMSYRIERAGEDLLITKRDFDRFPEGVFFRPVEISAK